MRNIPDKIYREIQNTNLMFLNFSFSKTYVCEIMWENIVERGRPQMTIWRMRIACWIPISTNIHSQYVIFVDFPLQQWLHGHISIFIYTYIACLEVCLSVHRCICVEKKNELDVTYDMLNMLRALLCPLSRALD